MSTEKKPYLYERRWIGWIGGACLATLFGIALFPIFAPFLPTFGSIEIESPTKRRVWKGSQITCRERLMRPVISFLDLDTGAERTITLFPGDEPLSSRPPIHPLGYVHVDGATAPLNKEACRTFNGFIRNERFGKRGGGHFEYRLSLDCDHANARLRVDLHGYSCFREE